MAVPNTGTIGISDIVTEFGGTTPHGLSEYYGVDSGVPSSGLLAISDFYGASASVVRRSSVYSPDISQGTSGFLADVWSNLSNIDGVYNGAGTDYAYNTNGNSGEARALILPFKPTLLGYTIPTGATIDNIFFYFLGAADIASGSLEARATATMWYLDTFGGTSLDDFVRFYADSNGPYPIARSESFTPSTIGISDAQFISRWNSDDVRMTIGSSTSSTGVFPKDNVGLRAYVAYCEITYTP